MLGNLRSKERECLSVAGLIERDSLGDDVRAKLTERLLEVKPLHTENTAIHFTVSMTGGNQLWHRIIACAR